MTQKWNSLKAEGGDQGWSWENRALRVDGKFGGALALTRSLLRPVTWVAVTRFIHVALTIDQTFSLTWCHFYLPHATERLGHFPKSTWGAGPELNCLFRLEVKDVAMSRLVFIDSVFEISATRGVQPRQEFGTLTPAQISQFWKAGLRREALGWWVSPATGILCKDTWWRTWASRAKGKR